MKNSMFESSQVTPAQPIVTKKPMKDRIGDLSFEIRRFIHSRTIKHNLCLIAYCGANLAGACVMTWKHTLGVISQLMFILSIILVAVFDTIFVYRAPSKRKIVHLSATILNITSCVLYMINTVSAKYTINVYWWRIGTAIISWVPFSPIQYLYFTVTLSTIVEFALMIFGHAIVIRHKEMWIRLVLVLLYLVVPLPALKAYQKVNRMLDKMILKAEVYEVVEDFVKSARDEMLLKERRDFKTESIYGGPRKVAYKIK